MKNKTIVMLAGASDTSAMVYNHLSKKYNIAAVVLETPQSRWLSIKGKYHFIRRRIKKLGIWAVFGQILFSIFVSVPQSRLSRKRVASIIAENDLLTTDIPAEKIIGVNSINDNEVVKVLQKYNPDVVIVNGTGIIKEHILSSVACGFINTHAGITPKYRGVHGMYWALANDDVENAGVTVHFVDKGIDTGGVIFQARTKPTPNDNFSTYFYLQIAEGVKILQKAVDGYLNNSLVCDTPPSESHLYSHPTIWRYVYNRFKKGVK